MPKLSEPLCTDLYSAEPARRDGVTKVLHFGCEAVVFTELT